MNQTFVNAVSSTGDKNAYRVLVIQGPTTSIDLSNTLMNAMRTDSVPAEWGEEAWLDSQFATARQKFVDKGIPVILGEFGAIRRTTLTGNDCPCT